ncbi:threonine--tRNA ligase [Treponema brennaborense]|uniref:Threonine--tRNA ligase n=1 Tax=Treponema brennaborense (strain DSM 12168 / CIP 105900 / DD5/3) TaxID=906968 RepID=F4LIT5_TREBD|nr:threonine--tRNA ligase [Treponema brennaborense]AEE16260.1 threonyl-tRNA synthetase [Treponema brennaborense DSM 12168]
MSAEQKERLAMIRHSTSHVMAQAVLTLFPGSKVAIGPSIDNGFYYDFELTRPITQEDLAAIEKEMRKIVSGNHEFTRREVSRAEALKMFADQPYKVELINDLPADEPISVYTQAGFTDLCRGPHVANTKEINAQSFKLMKTAGAYWRGDEKRPMLTRIYGTAWEKPVELKAYVDMLAEAERRDHRKIGKEMDLFHIDEDSPGQIFWHPNGWTIYRILEDYVRTKIKADGYVEVKTPFVMPQSLWERSGHWAKYKENMFITESEKRIFALKPMNCPGHIEIFKQRIRSYKDLPLRMAEFGSCTRNEASGALHGIMRVRGFVQDDAHIFCTEAQIPSEVAKFCHLLKDMYKDFGFTDDKILVKFSTRPEKRVGDDATWDRAEGALADACKQAGLAYEIQPGEGAFYGPKLEFTLVDALGREWQCGTIQVDYQLPSAERLNAEYIGDDNAKHHPVMLHRAVLGSLERFIGILIENFAGAFPTWLHYQQTVVIPVAPAFNGYAEKVQAALKAAGIRSDCDLGNDRMNAKIRLAQTQKIPYMLVVGEKEAADGTVAVRFRDGRPQQIMSVGDFTAYVRETVENHVVGI